MTVPVITRPTHYAFGRRAIPDPRDLWYLVGEHWPEMGAPSGIERMYYRRGPVQDAIKRPIGVACALLAALRSSPRPLASARCPSVEVLDEAARLVEGSLGREVTVRAGCQALRKLELIERYLWSYDVDEIVHYLLSGRGGMVLGLDWYAGMSHPDATGLIRAVGPPEGGHAVFAWGVDRAAGLLFIQNNWGKSWGGWQKGKLICQGSAKLPLDDLAKLLADNGEAVALIQTTPPRTAP